MTSTTLNYGITLLDPNQAQKDVTVNTALVTLDGFGQPSVISAVLASPPASPSDQDKYIVPAGATGVWAGHANSIAVYQANGSLWTFYPPRTGWMVYNQAASSLLAYVSGVWTTLAIISASSLLAALGALSPTAGNLIAGNGTTWITETPYQAFGIQAAMMALIYGG